jgi:long-chain acyl-CoA synthetase
MGLHDYTIYSLIQRNSRLNADRPALVFGEEKILYRQLLDRIDRLAAGLQRIGLQKGERIGVIAQNDPAFFYLYGAAAKIGAVMLPINWRLNPEEVDYIIADARPKIIFVAAEFQQLAASLTAKADFIRKNYSLGASHGDFAAFEELMGDKSNDVPVNVNGEDPYVIIHTAAVGGNPRGAVLTHSNMIAANLQSMVAWNLTDTDCHLCVLPLFHIAGLGACLNILHAGGCNVLLSKFDPDLALKHIQEQRVSLLPEFPPILSTLLERNKKLQYDLSSLRIVGGLDAPETIEQYEQQSDGTFWTGYGQTETSGMITYGALTAHPGTAGTPGVLTELAIMDEAGDIVATGQTGEIVIRGPLAFHGYWNLEKETEHTFRYGWHHTGDLGLLDENGYLRYAGRMPEKELIKPGGENVYPTEVEKIILTHPMMEAACVIGVPDKKWGEAVKAVCVIKNKGKLTAPELSEFVASKIARYKKPKYIVFVNQLPKAKDGAVDRTKVKKEYGSV